MTYGQLFMALNPNIKVIENGTCVWLYFDCANHDTLRAEWWNKEISDAAFKVQEPGWISVKDRLPEEDVEVLVSNCLGIEVAAYTTNPTRHWYGMSGNTVYAQYWMPLPEPPKEE